MCYDACQPEPHDCSRSRAQNTMHMHKMVLLQTGKVEVLSDITIEAYECTQLH